MTDATTLTKPAAEAKAARIPVGSAIYNEVLEFLYEEAALLDDNRFQDWLGVLAKDVVYSAPLRVTRNLNDKVSDIVRTVQHFDEDYSSIAVRILRLGTKSGWAEDPRSRTRRFVTNLLLEKTDSPDEFAATTNILLTRSRFDEHQLLQISGQRRDIVRRVEGGFNLAKREILLDQSVLGMPNLAIFL